MGITTRRSPISVALRRQVKVPAGIVAAVIVGAVVLLDVSK